MREYSIIPEFSYSKSYPFWAFIYQLVVIGFVVIGYFVTSVAFILAYIFQFCSFYYAVLYICKRYYRLNISNNLVTVWNIFNKPKNYPTDKLRWRIQRIPWYNSYFICLYTSGRIPVAIVKPHWKNALKIMRFPHLGELSSVELEYMKFLKSAGLL